MGKATDTPATAIEVRAAELAQTRSSESLMEWAGWQCHADDFPPNTGSAQAGWLAREIAFHEDPTP